MSTPQQPELHRSGLGASDPASAKTHVQVEPDRLGDPPAGGPVPEANTPGHHPDEEQDKPVAKFAERMAQPPDGGGNRSGD